MSATITAAAVREALATGTLGALGAACAAAGVDANRSCGKAMREALTAYLEGQPQSAVKPQSIQMETQSAPKPQSDARQGTVDKPVQGATGTAKCYVHAHTPSGVIYTPANGVQSLAYAFATVSTMAELSALLDMAEQLAAETEKRLSAKSVQKVDNIPVPVPSPVENKPAAPKAESKKPAPKSAAQTVATESQPAAPKPGKGKGKAKGDGLKAYRALQAKAKTMGLNASGTAEVLSARIKAAERKASEQGEAEQQTVKPDATGHTPKKLNRLEVMADALGVRLADMLAAAELAGVKLS